MKKNLTMIFTQSPLHVGAGNSVGVVDSPVMRERHTRIPIIPGSSLKGVFSDLWEETEGVTLFGSKDNAGKLLIGEAKVLAFPVRSAKGSFGWVTSPLILQRLARDYQKDIKIPIISDDSYCFSGKDVTFNDKHVILEEYKFESVGTNNEIADLLAQLSMDPIWKSIANRLVIISDEIFSYFVENACEIVTRIKINNISGTTEKGALFSIEQVPSETMFYTTIAVFDNQVSLLEQFENKIKEQNNIVQIGGDASIGLGYCSINFNKVGE